MPSARAWYVNNDMTLTLSGLRSSTMASGNYLNGSVSVKASIWKAYTTASISDRLYTGLVLGYISGSNGNYRYIAQSTAFSAIHQSTPGMCIITVQDSGLDGEWRVPFNGEYRGTS